MPLSVEARLMKSSGVLRRGAEPQHSGRPRWAPEIEGLTKNFFLLVARNRRLFAVADMVEDFRALLARERGEVSADVAAAASSRRAK